MVCPYCRNDFNQTKFVVLKDEECTQTIMEINTKRNQLLNLINENINTFHAKTKKDQCIQKIQLF